MSNHARPPTMVLGALLAVAACGGGKGATETEPTAEPFVDPDPQAPAAALEPGSSGFPGLDWGDSKDAVTADYPQAAADGDGLALQASHGGRDATISFMFAPDSLIAIGVSYPDRFASMSACGETFAQVRAELDQALGASSADNLAAYWSGEATSITLSCDPDGEDGEAASLSMTYTLPDSDEQ